MSDTSRVNTLGMVARKAMAYADANSNQHIRFLQFAIDGWRKLRRNTVREGVSFLKVTPNAINRISFPQDMEEFIGLGVPVGGKLYLLTEDKRIIATYSTNVDGDYLDEEDGEGVELPKLQLSGIKATGGFNLHGYYTVDWENDYIIVNANERSELLLVYMTSGTDLQHTTYVPTKAVDALIAYILWANVRFDMRVPISERQYFEAEWLKAKNRLDKNELFSVPEFRDHWTRSNNLLRR